MGKSELPILEALYAVQKLVEPLPEPLELTISMMRSGSPSVVFYVLENHYGQWCEAIKKHQQIYPTIIWHVF